MKRQKTEVRSHPALARAHPAFAVPLMDAGRRLVVAGCRQKTEDRIRFGIKIALVCLLFSVFCPLSAFSSEKWPGVDESVVEKYAKEQGRQAHEPLINTDQGDLLLFVFLIAGTVGGFAAGYYWRILMVEKAPGNGKEKQNNINRRT